MSESKRIEKRPIHWMKVLITAMAACAVVLVAFYLLRPESPVSTSGTSPVTEVAPVG